MTIIVALFQCGIIQKFQINRLFNFIHISAGEKNFGDVGFTLLYLGNRMRIKIGCFHELKNFFLMTHFYLYVVI
jgi:hypothetical protein